MPRMKFSAKQQHFIHQVIKGQHIFLTGLAGAGKTAVVKKIVDILTEKGRNVACCAPTGIAAMNMGGSTIHSMFAINPFGVMDYDSCNFLKPDKRLILKKIQTIIIDEVSMLRPDLLDAINWTLIKNGAGGLRNKQVIFVGDMKQLKPVIRDNQKAVMYREYNGDTFEYAKIYPKLNVKEIFLDEVFRQEDMNFIDSLNIVRNGGRSDYFRQFVSNSPSGIILAPTNAVVAKYNQKGLDSLKGETFIFNAKIEGDVKFEDFSLEREIQVKQGAKIMYLVNNSEKSLVNGTLGIFVSYKDQHYIRVGETDFPIERVEVVKKDYVYDPEKDKIELKEIGKITQMPIKLAYALTIHKSQGLTFDEVTVDLSNKGRMMPGMLYVALSRVRTPQGLKLIM